MPPCIASHPGDLRLLTDGDAQIHQLPAEAGHISVEDDPVHAGLFRPVHVGGGVVYEDALRGIQAIGLIQHGVDLSVGLEKLVVRGDDKAIEELAAGDAGEVLIEVLGGVGEQVDAVSQFFQLLDQLRHARHGLPCRLPPAAYQPLCCWVQPRRQPAADGHHRLRAVHGAPVHGDPLLALEDLLDKGGDILFGNSLPGREVYGIEADEDAAEVKNNILLLHDAVASYLGLTGPILIDETGRVKRGGREGFCGVDHTGPQGKGAV